jgi:hypothetical protein
MQNFEGDLPSNRADHSFFGTAKNFAVSSLKAIFTNYKRLF